MTGGSSNTIEAQIVVGIAVGLVLLILGAIGWSVRVMLSSQGKVRAELQRLSTYMEITKVTGPTIARRLDDSEDLINEHTTQIALLREGQISHERWHERRHESQVTP